MSLREPVDYKDICILTRNVRSKTFEEDCVGPCNVIGAVCEVSLRVAYRPEVDSLPCPLALQTSGFFPSVTLHDVLPQGETRARQTLAVKVYPRDAERALAVVRSVVSKLQHDPYNLEVLTVDHTGGSTCQSAHDLLMTPRLGTTSCLASGLYSVELRCREIKDRKAYDWEGVLTREALPLLVAEQRKKRRKTEPLLHGRIVVLACFPRPCHSGPESLHASISYGSGWERLWGWSGFKTPVPLEASPKPKAKAKAAATKRASGRNAPSDVVSPQVRLQQLFAKPGMQSDWVKLVCFLKHLKLPRSQARRDYLEGPYAWRTGARKAKLSEPADWMQKPGNRGGVPPIFVRRAKLEEVFLKYYAEQ